MRCVLSVLSVAVLLSLTTIALAADTADQTKKGTIKSVDVKAQTFVLDLPARPLTFVVSDKTTITLDGKDATFDAIKADLKATVTYTRSGDSRIASKVELTTPTPPDTK